MDRTGQRIDVLKRLREMLQRQREKFGAYLELLEREEESIQRGDTERLLAQVEMERAIIAEVFALRKVIVPLETLYQAAYPGTEDTVPRLRAALDIMGAEIAAHNEKNRRLLKQRMEEMRREITSLRAWPRTGSPFRTAEPSMIDITT
jgi:hypothetical protein